MERTYLWKRGLLQIRLFYFYFSRTGCFVFCREWELDMYDKVFVYSAQWSNGAYIWSHWFDPNIHENLITIFLLCSQCPYIDCLFKANIRLCFDISLISDCVLIFLWHEAVFQYISHIRLCLWSFHPSRYPQSPPIAMLPYVIHLRYFNHHHHNHARQHK